MWKVCNGRHYDSVLLSLGITTCACTLAVTVGHWMTDYCFHYIVASVTFVLVVVTMYDFFVYQPKASALRRAAQTTRAISVCYTLNNNNNNNSFTTERRRKMPLYYSNSRFTSAKRSFMAFYRSNTMPMSRVRDVTRRRASRWHRTRETGPQ